jgi:hypothetical protein
LRARLAAARRGWPGGYGENAYGVNGLKELTDCGTSGWVHVPQNWGFQFGIVTMATRITTMTMRTAVEDVHIVLTFGLGFSLRKSRYSSAQRCA